MNRTNRLPDAELAIMMVIWEAGTPVNSDYMTRKLNKDWARSTLLKLLSRLEARGFVEFYKESRYKMYVPKVKKEDYLKIEQDHFLQKLHFNSVVDMVASFYQQKIISREELTQLERFIQKEADQQ